MSQRGDATKPMPLAERLVLANELFQEYHTRCFWHCRRDLEITEDLLPLVVKGLRAHGGRRGFILASKLLHETNGLEKPEAKCP